MAGGIFIDVSNNSDGSSAQQCVHDRIELAGSETRVYTCPCEMYGRYVRIRYPVNQREYLTLCEVQIQSGGKRNTYPYSVNNDWACIQQIPLYSILFYSMFLPPANEVADK